MMSSLKRSLTLSDAIMIGLGSMLGAGIFVAVAPATAHAGSGIYIALGLAALVALCNATSSGQLAAQYPVAGGTYAYGRAQLGPAWGLTAGWAFLLGKTASAAAMAMTFAHYALPGAPPLVLSCAAALALIALTTVNILGVSKTATATKVIVLIVLAGLALFVATSWLGTPAEVATPSAAYLPSAPLGILQGAGILFFAFAGYARVATLGEEVTNPTRTIPRAIMWALGLTLVVYVVITFTLTHMLDQETLAQSTAPIFDAVQVPWMELVVQVVAALACLGALLGLMAGLGRTCLAMARDSRHFTFFAHVSERYSTPARAEILFCVLAIILVFSVDVTRAVGFSSTGVLLYYAIANLAAFTQDREHRMYPKALQVLGVVLCVAIGFTVSLPGLLLGAGAAVVIAGVALVSNRRGRS